MKKKQQYAKKIHERYKTDTKKIQKVYIKKYLFPSYKLWKVGG